MFFIFFVMSIIFVEAATELICKSMFFSSTREFLARRLQFFRELLGCGYCTSVWVAILPAFFLSLWFTGGLFLKTAPTFILFMVVLHRLSNKFHDFGDKHLDKYYDSRYQDSSKKE